MYTYSVYSNIVQLCVLFREGLLDICLFIQTFASLSIQNNFITISSNGYFIVSTDVIFYWQDYIFT